VRFLSTEKNTLRQAVLTVVTAAEAEISSFRRIAIFPPLRISVISGNTAQNRVRTAALPVAQEKAHPTL